MSLQYQLKIIFTNKKINVIKLKYLFVIKV